jgi:hypothetical protein
MEVGVAVINLVGVRVGVGDMVWALLIFVEEKTSKDKTTPTTRQSAKRRRNIEYLLLIERDDWIQIFFL